MAVSYPTPPAAGLSSPGTRAGSGTDVPEERKGPGASLLLLALPVLCCGGPFIFGALAAASAATLGVVGGVIGAFLVAIAAGLWVRRRHRVAACCAGPKASTPKAWRP